MKLKDFILPLTVGLVSFFIIYGLSKIEEPEKPDCIDHPSYVWTCNDGKGNVAYCTEWKDLVNGKWVTKYNYGIGSPKGYQDVTEKEAREWCEDNAVESCNL